MKRSGHNDNITRSVSDSSNIAWDKLGVLEQGHAWCVRTEHMSRIQRRQSQEKRMEIIGIKCEYS